MTFTYSGDPSASTVEQVRFLLQDTTTPGHKFEDEEITWMLTEEPDPWFCAAALADQLVSKYSGQAQSKTIGETSVTYGDLTMKYQGLAQSLRNTRRQRPVAPYAGGISKADKETVEQDDDREELVAKKTEVPDPAIT